MPDDLACKVALLGWYRLWRVGTVKAVKETNYSIINQYTGRTIVRLPEVKPVQTSNFFLLLSKAFVHIVIIRGHGSSWGFEVFNVLEILSKEYKKFK